MQPSSEPLSVLVVSYIFLPVGEVGAKRIGEFCRYLPEAGIRPVVLTAQERFYKFQDASVPPPEGIQLARTTVWPTPLELYARLRRRSASRGRPAPTGEPSSAEVSEGARPESLLKRHLLALLQLPAPYAGWYFPAVREGSRLIEQQRIAAILSTGPPWISHLVARRLKKKYRLPWLADFRDPWGSGRIVGNRTTWEQRIRRDFEASSVEKAERVVCTTERLCSLFRSAYPFLRPEKFVLLPNGFDDLTEIDTLPRVLSAPRLFLHSGTLYAQRRIDTFCQALEMLVKSGALSADSFRVVLLGDADPALVAAAKNSAPELFAHGSIEFRPRVSWTEAQSLIWQADYLLLFQGHFRLEVPAKFFEYLLTGKPMLASAKEGALTDIVKATESGVCADPDDPADIARQLERLLQWPLRTPEEVHRKWAAQYHYRALTTRLADLIRSVVGTTDAA